MKNLLLILLCVFILSCNFKKENNIKKENKIKVTYERGYGPKLIQYVWEGDHRSEKYDMNDSVLNYERIYINGVLDSSTEFYGNGNLWFQTEYTNGVRDGKHICYNEDTTTIKDIQVYENDTLVSTVDMSYFDNGQLKSEITTKNGISDGPTVLYHENGRIRTKGFFKEGESSGIWSVYYENGQIRTEGEWKDGKPTGIWKYYEEDGQFVKQSKFLNGELIDEKWN